MSRWLGKVGKDGDVGAGLEGHELEGGQLQHCHVVLPHLPGLREQGLADVPPQVDGIAGVFQHFRDEGGCGGLAIAAGDGDDLAGADLEKGLHLRGQHTPFLDCRQEGRDVRPDAGGAEDHVLIQSLQIVRAQPQLGAQGLQFLRQCAKAGFWGLVTGGHGDSRLEQGFDQRGVGHPNADDGHAFSPKGCQIVLQCHGPFLLLKLRHILAAKLTQPPWGPRPGGMEKQTFYYTLKSPGFQGEVKDCRQSILFFLSGLLFIAFLWNIGYNIPVQIQSFQNVRERQNASI